MQYDQNGFFGAFSQSLMSFCISLGPELPRSTHKLVSSLQVKARSPPRSLTDCACALDRDFTRAAHNESRIFLEQFSELRATWQAFATRLSSVPRRELRDL